MKKLIVFAILLFSANAFAASSTVWTVQGGGDWIEVQAVFTCDASAATYTTEVFKDAAGNTLDLDGYYLYHIAYYYGSTAPTDNSDLTVLEHSSSGRDILHGCGANVIDNATNNDFKPCIGAAPAAMPIYGPLYLAIANNAVNSATGTLIFRFIK
jgi:hypothetical protein